MSMVPASIKPWIEPLLAAAQRLGGRHVTLFGSAARRPLAEVSDLDLHLVLPSMDRSAFDALAAAAGETAQALAGRTGRPCGVELRHGPFKPAPADPPGLQLHLLLDDEESVARLSCALLTQRAVMGRLLAGGPLLDRRKDCASPAVWMREAREELERWRGALMTREIPFRHWRFDPGPRLTESRFPASTLWDLECLLRGAGGSTDLHYRAALGVAGLPAGEGAARPLLSQIPEGRDLATDWDQIRDQAVGILERRLRHLAGMDRHHQEPAG